MNDGDDDDDDDAALAAHVPPSLLPSFLGSLRFLWLCLALPSFLLPKSSFDAGPREWHAHGEDVMACHGWTKTILLDECGMCANLPREQDV